MYRIYKSFLLIAFSLAFVGLALQPTSDGNANAGPFYHPYRGYYYGGGYGRGGYYNGSYGNGPYVYSAPSYYYSAPVYGGYGYSTYPTYGYGPYGYYGYGTGVSTPVGGVYYNPYNGGFGIGVY